MNDRPPMNPRPLRVALIGCGRWGRNIARTLARLGVLSLIVDPDTAGIQQFANDLGVTTSDDVGQAFSDAIDAVAIAVPAVDHARIICLALEAGKHVFVEKPLALNLDDAGEAAALAKARGLTLMVGHLLQYHPAFVQLKRMVEDGQIGELRHITSNRLNPGAIRSEENALWSMAPHDFSMVLSLSGKEPLEIAALSTSIVQPGIPDQYSIHLRFSEVLTAHVNVSWLSPFKEHKLVALGTTGALVFEDTAADSKRKLVLYRDYIDHGAGAPRFVKAAGEPVEFPLDEPLEAEMKHFLSCVSGECVPRTGPEEAIPVLRLLREADRAARAQVRA